MADNQTRYYKYYIVNTDAKNLNSCILGCSVTLHQAIELLNNYLDKTYEFNDYLKCFYVNSSTVCIYRYHYILSKELINKVTIIKYPVVSESCDRCNLIDM